LRLGAGFGRFGFVGLVLIRGIRLRFRFGCHIQVPGWLLGCRHRRGV
jgi:hypothetical protein